MVDYEFEERLNSFYESEPIENGDLVKLYEGEFPEGERNPQKLRIHWKDARELALAELELQKSIQKSWQNADVSERPILVLDRDGGDFYRYYEYRVVKDKNLLGAIRIPAYRRTENFATAEVHFYSDDEKTYTIHPTGWGRYVASRIYYSSDTELFKSIQDQVNVIITDNMIFNMSYYLYGAFDVDHKIPEVSTYTAYSKLTNLYHQHSSALDSSKVSLIAEEKDVIIDAAARKETYKLQEQLNQMQKTLTQFEIIVQMIPLLKPAMKDMFITATSNSYTASTGYVFDNMALHKNSCTAFEKILKIIFWEQIEKEISSISQQKLFSINWDMAKLLQNKNITPVVHYYNFHQYPKKRNLNHKEFSAFDYTVLPLEKHAKFIDPTIGFKLNDQNVLTSLLKDLKKQNSYHSESQCIKLEYLDDIVKLQLATSINQVRMSTKIISQDDIDNLINAFEKEIEEVLIEFTDVFNGITQASITTGTVMGAILGSSAAGWGVSLLFVGPAILITSAVIRDSVQSASDEIDSLIDSVIKDLGGKEFLADILLILDELLDLLFEKGYISEEQKNNFTKIADALEYHIKNGGGMLVAVFKLLFDRWAVWVIPILPFPTWVHYTDKWGMIPDWQYKLGIFDILTLDMSNIMKPEDNPKDISPPKMPPPRPINTTPEGLEKYDQEWEIIYSWIQFSGLLDTDNLGNFKNITEQEAKSIINYITDLTKQIYIDKIILNEQGETIYTTDKVLLDKGLGNLLNSDGREYIEQIASFNMSEFKW